MVCPDGSGGNSGGNTDNPSCPEAKCSVQLTCVNNKVNYSCSCTGNGSCEPPSETVELTCSTSAGDNGSGDAYEWGEDDLPCQGLVCPKGLVIKSGNDYYYITKDLAYFSSDELANPKKYKIEDLQAYGHNNMLVKMNRSKKLNVMESVNQIFWRLVIYILTRTVSGTELVGRALKMHINNLKTIGLN